MSTIIAALETDKGTITAELFRRDCPVTVENFWKLANDGFYDGTRFHKLVGGKTIHAGDPRSRELPADDPAIGTGGPGYTIPCEIIGNRNRHVTGALAMHNDGPDTGGSRFYIVLDGDNCDDLQGKHTVFGRVTGGIAALAELKENDEIRSVRVME